MTPADLHPQAGLTMEAWVYPESVSDWRSVTFLGQSNGLMTVLYANNAANVPSGYMQNQHAVEAQRGVRGPQAMCVPLAQRGLRGPQAMCVPLAQRGVRGPQAMCVPLAQRGLRGPQAMCVPLAQRGLRGPQAPEKIFFLTLFLPASLTRKERKEEVLKGEALKLMHMRMPPSQTQECLDMVGYILTNSLHFPPKTQSYIKATFFILGIENQLF